MKWYFLNEENEVVGPVSEDDLRGMLDSGSLSLESQVCREGSEEWGGLNEILGGFPQLKDRSPVNGEAGGRKVLKQKRKIYALIGAVGLLVLGAVIFFASARTDSSAKLDHQTVLTTHLSKAGVPDDPEQAFNQYREAAEQGDAEAQGVLALLYSAGHGVEENDEEARKWWGISADGGNPYAQYREGERLRWATGGKGVLSVKAYMWFDLAASGDDRSVARAAKKGRSELEETLSLSEIKEAKRMSREWKPKDLTNPFANRESTKADVLGLRGGMSKDEALATLDLDRFDSATNDAEYPEKWTSSIPGFEAVQFTPDPSFPIKHISKIRLVFLKGSLQSVCYVFERNECQIYLWDGGANEIRDYRSNPNDYYDRDELISDIETVIGRSFDPIETPLYRDYTSGIAIPETGSYTNRYDDKLRGDDMAYLDSVDTMFSAASDAIFVRFCWAVKNYDAIIRDLNIEVSRPNMVSADRITSEYFFLQFSFAESYSESLAVGNDHLSRERAQKASETKRVQREEGEENEAAARAEEERIRKLSNGL